MVQSESLTKRRLFEYKLVSPFRHIALIFLKVAGSIWHANREVDLCHRAADFRLLPQPRCGALSFLLGLRPHSGMRAIARHA